MIMENFLYPNHSLRCTICGPGVSGKTVFLTNSILNNINEYEKICIYSTYLHQY